MLNTNQKYWNYQKHEVREELFKGNLKKHILQREKTVYVFFEDDNHNRKFEKYGYIENKVIFEMIEEGKEINLNGCFIENFLISKYEERKTDIDPEISIKKLLASNCFFYGDIFFTDIIFEYVEIKNSIFNGNTYFTGTVFNNNVYFTNVIFVGDAIFWSTEFNNDASFSRSYFHNVANFDESFFRFSVFFISSIFNGIANFEKMIVRKVASFSSATFHKTVSFCNSEFNSINTIESKLLLLNTQFESTANFKEVNAESLNLEGCIFKEHSIFENTEIKKSNRKSFQMIKNECFKILDIEEAFKFKRLEMIELKKNKKKRNEYGDWIILKISSISNNHGTSWWRGLLFTSIVALIFYIPYISFGLDNSFWEWGWKGWDSFFSVFCISFKYYWHFLFAAHKFDFIEGYSSNGLGAVFDILGRIFVSIGYYQTISPLKKYK